MNAATAGGNATEARLTEARLAKAAEQRGYKIFRSKGPVLSRRYSLRILPPPTEIFIACANLAELGRAIHAETLGQALGMNLER